MKIRVAVLGVCVAALTSGCGASSEPDDAPDVPTSPIDQMVITFQGSPTKADLTDALDNAMNATQTAITDENYSRAGSVLVTFRKKNGFSEMKILECMPKRADDPRLPSLTFPHVAAVCITDLVQGNYP